MGLAIAIAFIKTLHFALRTTDFSTYHIRYGPSIYLLALYATRKLDRSSRAYAVPVADRFNWGIDVVGFRLLFWLALHTQLTGKRLLQVQVAIALGMPHNSGDKQRA